MSLFMPMPLRQDLVSRSLVAAVYALHAALHDSSCVLIIHVDGELLRPG